MEVVDSVQYGRYRAVLILGHPKDLIRYDERRKPGCYILIAVENAKFYLVTCGPAVSREKLYVDAVKKAPSGQIRGVPSARPRMEHTLIYRTNPDHQVAAWLPGIGLTAYVYSHHGTASEVNMKLVEFHVPGSTSGTASHTQPRR